MIIISYDIADDKKRARFNKFIRRFGHRLQYSVYEIDNSEKILDKIVTEINHTFLKVFDDTDSVYIFQLSGGCKVQKFGYASHEDTPLLIVQ